MNSLEKAVALACKTHGGQVDKSGQPYILHPLRVMLKFQSENERIVSVLHDVVEDSNVSLDELRQLGFPEEVIDAIECLTKRATESYEHFISRLASNHIARKVKIEDIKDNLDLTRLEMLSDEDLSRIGKYHKALQHLLRVKMAI